MEELSSVHRYAAGGLLALALNQAQIHRQSVLPEFIDPEDSPSSSARPTEEPPWSSEQCGLLRHVFRYLNIDTQAWAGIELTAAFPDARHHVGPFLRILQEENEDSPSSSSSGSQSVIALANAVEAMTLSLQDAASSRPLSTGAQRLGSGNVLENELPSSSRAKSSGHLDSMTRPLLEKQSSDSEPSKHSPEHEELAGMSEKIIKNHPKVTTLVSQRKVAVLYELLTACVADTPEEKAGKSLLRAGYDARQRAALRLLALWLDVEWEKVAAMEVMVAYMAMAAENEKASQGSDENEEKKTKWDRWKRGSIIGVAAVTGGALMAVTGGLAAPAIAAGLSAIAPAIAAVIPVLGVSGMAAAVGSAAGSVAVAASFGAAGAGLAGSKMARRTGGVDEFSFEPIGYSHQQGRLAVAIVVSGIIFEPEDFTRPWEGSDGDMERYALRWETKNLMAVSTAIEDWLASSVAKELMKAGAMMTVLAGLVAALAWPATLLAATDFIDGKWSIAVDRSDKAGKILAKCLLSGAQGNRPVTLIGFSLGARVVFSCLEYLAKKGNNGSIVERVVLLGAPLTLETAKWEMARKMVAGRFVNAYSTNDWILAVIYRASFLSQGLAGLQRVEIPGIENIDVTELVNGHSKYLTKTNEILQAIDIDSFYPIYPSKLYATS